MQKSVKGETMVSGGHHPKYHNPVGIDLYNPFSLVWHKKQATE